MAEPEAAVDVAKAGGQQVERLEAAEHVGPAREAVHVEDGGVRDEDRGQQQAVVVRVALVAQTLRVQPHDAAAPAVLPAAQHAPAAGQGLQARVTGNSHVHALHGQTTAAAA